MEVNTHKLGELIKRISTHSSKNRNKIKQSNIKIQSDIAEIEKIYSEIDKLITSQKLELTGSEKTLS
jgi:hypothetical protein